MEGPLSIFHLYRVDNLYKMVEFDLQMFEVVDAHRANAYSSADGMEIIQCWISESIERGARVLFFIHTEIIAEPAVQVYLGSAKPYPFGFFEVAEGADWEAQFLADIPGFLSMVDRALAGPVDAARAISDMQKTMARSERKIDRLVQRIGAWQKSTDHVLSLQRKVVSVLHGGIGDLLALLEPAHPDAVRAISAKINQGLAEIQAAMAEPPPPR